MIKLKKKEQHKYYFSYQKSNMYLILYKILIKKKISL